MSGWEDNSFIFIRLPVQTYSEREKRERQRKGVWHAVCGCACYMAALVTLCVCVCVRQHRGRFVKPREDCWLAAVTNGPFNVVWTPSPKTLTKPLKIHMAIWTASRLLEGEHICMCVAGKQSCFFFFRIVRVWCISMYSTFYFGRVNPLRRSRRHAASLVPHLYFTEPPRTRAEALSF